MMRWTGTAATKLQRSVLTLVVFVGATVVWMACSTAQSQQVVPRGVSAAGVLGEENDTAAVITRVSNRVSLTPYERNRPAGTPGAQSTSPCPGAIEPSMGGDSVQRMVDATGWYTGCSPMWTDDQSFNNGDGSYGPVAHIVPAPVIEGGIAGFEGPDGAAAAFIFVEPLAEGQTLGQPYRNLHLGVGLSCVYLKHDAKAKPIEGWTGWVTPHVRYTCPVKHPRPTGPAVELTVIARQHRKFTSPDDYPAVARFHEGKHGPRKDMPLFGMRCASAWCFFLPKDGSVGPSERVGVHPNNRRWEIMGWGDEQHLAQGSPPTMHADWTWNASIVSAPKLGEKTIALDFDEGYEHVATIWLKEDPPAGSKYADKWHLKKGKNYIFLKHSGTDPNAGWSGIVARKLKKWNAASLLWERVFGEGITELKVNRMPHPEHNPPGTARFKWKADDEDGWARCDWGCCELGV